MWSFICCSSLSHLILSLPSRPFINYHSQNFQPHISFSYIYETDNQRLFKVDMGTSEHYKTIRLIGVEQVCFNLTFIYMVFTLVWTQQNTSHFEAELYFHSFSKHTSHQHSVCDNRTAATHHCKLSLVQDSPTRGWRVSPPSVSLIPAGGNVFRLKVSVFDSTLESRNLSIELFSVS